MSESPRLNFRKLGYAEEKELSRLILKTQHLVIGLSRQAGNGTFDDTMAELEANEVRMLEIILTMVEYLPEDYLREGVKPDAVPYGDPDEVVKLLSFAAVERLTKFATSQREALTKNS